jgi:hypothetical protein
VNSACYTCNTGLVGECNGGSCTADIECASLTCWPDICISC